MEFKNPDDKPKTYYLAGKMSGIKQFNIPRFYEVAAKLREAGFKVINPAELDTPEMRDAALRSLTGEQSDVTMSESWGEVLGRDVTVILDKVNAIVLFENWTQSKGARLEAFSAHLQGHDIMTFTEDRDGVLHLHPVSLEELTSGVMG